MWRQDGNQQNSYGFSYDKISRLLGYDHLVITYNNGMFAATQTNSFTEQGITYDRNGNILSLIRNTDTFSYLYSGNQLSTVNGQNYTYDPNGNMVTDGQNSRSFEYNALNLISSVQNSSSSASYRWLSDGTKASVVDDQGYGFEYLGSFVYQKAPTDLALESISFGAGRFVANSIGSLTAQYQIVDHLGSVRVVFTSSTNVVAQNDYYAFGLRHSNPNLAQNSANRHLFNGKEWQSTSSVGLLDYGARPYDPNTGRWINVDLLTEKYYSISPYVYCVNNPLKYVDPTGMELTDYYNLNGKLVRHIEDGKNQKLLVLITSNKDRYINSAISDNRVVNVPSNEILHTMEIAFSLTENTGSEHYFRVGQNGTISNIVQGVPGAISNESIMSTASDLTNVGDYVAYDVHTHDPNVTMNGSTINYGAAQASPTDISNVIGDLPNVVLGYGIKQRPPSSNQIGGSSTISTVRQIGFYNKDGHIGEPIDFERYKNAIKKINK